MPLRRDSVSKHFVDKSKDPNTKEYFPLVDLLESKTLESGQTN